MEKLLMLGKRVLIILKVSEKEKVKSEKCGLQGVGMVCCEALLRNDERVSFADKKGRHLILVSIPN